MTPIRRRLQNPIWRRRLGCDLIWLAAAAVGVASWRDGAWLWIAAAIVFIAGVSLEAKTSDGLMTLRYPGTKRRSLVLGGAGAIALIASFALRSRLPNELDDVGLSAGAGFALAGFGALAWHYAATYAGNRIVTLSDEEW